MTQINPIQGGVDVLYFDPRISALICG